MGRRLALAGIMLAVGAVLLAWAGLAPSAASVTTGRAAEARKGGTLLLSRPYDFEYIDPALAYDSDSWSVGFATCARLFRYPDEPGAAGTRLVPEVVRDTSVSRDRRVYTFDLKRIFRFHTGAAVTAGSFAAALNRVANPRLKSPATDYLREVVGAVAVIEGKEQAISGVRVLGPYRLQIRLTRPVGDFTARLTLPFFCPILPKTPIAPEGINNPPGSGPYYVAERVVNRRVVLRRNPYYHGGRPANVDQIVVTIGESREACLLAAEQDRVDLCLSIPYGALRRLAAQYGVNRTGGQLFVTPALATYYLAFNHDRQAFKGRGQIALKKAINYAIDRPELTRAFGYLAGRRTDQMLLRELGRDEHLYPLGGADPALARKWVAKARHKPRTLVLYAWNSEIGVAVAGTLRFNLKQIGIDLKVKYYAFKEVVQKAATRGEPFDLVLSGWFSDWADSGNFIEPLLNPAFRKGAHANYSYYSSPRVTARIMAASRLSGAARRKAWVDLDAYLMRNDPPWAPFLNGTYRTFVSQSYGCFLATPALGIDLAAACKK